MRKFLFLAFLLVIFIPSIAVGQASLTGYGSVNHIAFKSIPKIPAPNQLIQLSVESYSTNLNKMMIVWYLDGEEIESGYGVKSIQFRTGETGTKQIVKVLIKKLGNVIMEKTHYISPADVNIIFESDTYTPPFYRGKTLPSHQTRVKIIAIPNFIDSNNKKVDQDNIMYSWRINGWFNQDQSGVGKNVYIYDGPLVSRPVEVEVTAEDIDSNLVAKKTETLYLIEPEIIFYEKNPIYGTIFERAISDKANLNGVEIEISGAPYFFDISNTQNINFRWSADGNEVSNGVEKSIVLRRTDGNPGNIEIGLEIENFDKILQYTKSNFSLFYEEIFDLDFSF